MGGRLVLTSAHVVARLGERVEVFRPGAASAVGGAVVWCGGPAARDDAALVLVDGDQPWTVPAGAVRWGRLVTDRPGTGCETWGVPDVAQRPPAGGPVEAVQLTGLVNPGTGFVGNQYVMDLLQHPPQWSAEGTSPWGGLSGAAVFCDRLLTGVVAADRAHSAHGQLNTVPVYVLFHDPAFRTVLAEHTGQEAGLEAVEFQSLADSTASATTGALRSPAALLQAGRQTVPFHGREDLLELLTDWCGRDGFGARLLHGPGGQGKTRLAHHLGHLLAADRWAVLWPHPDATPDELREVRHTAKPLLVVVDYAENRARQLTALIEAAAEHPGTTPFKFLLLARTDGDWWAKAKHATRVTEDHLDGAPSHLLPPLEHDPASRPQAYRDAARALAAALPHVSGCAGTDWSAAAEALRTPQLDQDGYANALTLHMTALADLLDVGAPTGDDAQSGAEGVEDRLLGHERRYWTRTAAACGLSPALSPTALETALAAAHLVGAADRDQADRTWRSLPALADQPRDRRDTVTSWIGALYPPTVPGRPWGGLQPDRLAERHAGRVLDADPALAALLVQESEEDQTAQLLSVYARAASHLVFTGRLDAHLTDLCVRHHDQLAAQTIATATQTDNPNPLITALEALTTDPATPLDVLDTLYWRLPESSQRLAHTTARLATTITEQYRALAEEDPDAYLPSLAVALSRLSTELGVLGRWEDALAASKEAVDIHRGLAEAEPDRYVPRLASSLHTLSVDLGEMGWREEGLAAIQEAVRIRRDLAEADPDTYLPYLAASLHGLSIDLRDAGRRKEGLATVQEAVDIHKELAEADPDAHLPKLAGSLHSLSIDLGEAGRGAEGLAAIQEAVRIRRDLAEADPDAHLPDLAQSLNCLAIDLGSVGSLEEALAAVQEAARHYQRLSTLYPVRFAVHAQKSREITAWLISLG
ncbi:tetratricopeptide repeat protein [Streptomyces sp. NPDC048057]|uniref:tetratricopeptide repeat protein n=1 Tax=Streptomyces sp. NPDC048057 TaxID=3155628 RepID=UPI0033F38DED